MGHFGGLIVHLNRKKSKKGEKGISKPIYEEDCNGTMLRIDYNYYYACVTYEPKRGPLYRPYRLWIEKPCVINSGGGQFLGIAESETWCADEEDVWLTLQSKWAKTLH